MKRATSSHLGRRIAQILLVVGLFATGVSKAAPVRAEPTIELLTMGPGDALFSRFGHTALRVIDPERGRDWVYNYGAAPFRRPDFVWGFLRGQSRFYVAISPYLLAVLDYQLEDRTLVRQRLNLTPAQTYDIIRFLNWNALPENREYYYDHLLDNCSTRVRDILDDITGGALQRAVASWPVTHTYRLLTLEAGAGSLLNQIGLDLVSGPNQAEAVDGWAMLYLPKYLQDAATEAIVDESRGVPLAGPVHVIYERQGPPPIVGSPFAGRRVVVGFGLAMGFWLLGIGVLARRRSGRLVGALTRLSGLWILLLGLVFGLLGVVFIVLGVVSKVADTHWNENVWVFIPLDLWWVGAGIGLLLLGRRRIGRSLRVILDFKLAVLGGYTLMKLVGVFPQSNWAFLIAMALITLGLRLGWPVAPRRA